MNLRGFFPKISNLNRPLPLQLGTKDGRFCFRFSAFSCQDLLLVCIAYPLQLTTMDLLFISKIRVFES